MLKKYLCYFFCRLEPVLQSIVKDVNKRACYTKQHGSRKYFCSETLCLMSNRFLFSSTTLYLSARRFLKQLTSALNLFLFLILNILCSVRILGCFSSRVFTASTRREIRVALAYLSSFPSYRKCFNVMLSCNVSNFDGFICTSLFSVNYEI